MTARKNLRPGNSPTPTAGETVGDEVTIELIRDPKDPPRLTLLRCDGGRRKVGPRQKLGGTTYTPVAVDPSLAKRLRLPVRTSPYGSTRKLFAAIEDAFRKFGGLNERAATLATYISFGTFFWDLAPIAPCLVLTGPDAFQAAQLLKVFDCVTRHPVLLSGLGASLYDVAHSVQPTILLHQPSRSSLVKRLLAASQVRGFSVARQGTVEELFGAKVMYLGDRSLKGLAAETTIPMALSPAPPGSPVLTEDIETDLASEFQSKLLEYRIETFGKVRRSAFDAPQLSGSARVLARFLGSCLPGDRDLQVGVLRSLAGMDQAARVALAQRPESLLIEALLIQCHERKATIYVGDVTNNVNALLRERGETLKVTARAVGPKIASLGIFTERDASGYAFKATNEVRRQVHQLAKAYSVPTFLKSCQLCREFYPRVE
jgi:hypothetical protein